MDTLNYSILIIGLLLSVSIFASRISSIMGLPVLLLFLGIGMLCGSEGIFLKIAFNNYDLAFMIANIALAVILFSGGWQTSLSTFRNVAVQSVVLSTVGVLITSAIVGGAAYYLFKLPFYQCMLVGAIVGSTDAGAVFSLLGNNGVTLKNKVESPLQIESATNDPMAIFLTMTLISLIRAENSGTAVSMLDAAVFFVKQFAFGTGFGIIFGLLARYLISIISIPTGLYTLLVIGIAFTGFAITASLDGSGFLAIFIIGMCIGNRRNRQVNYILPVLDGLTWLSQIGLFLILGLLVTPSSLMPYMGTGIIIALVLTFIARPVAVFLCLKPFFTYSTADLSFISWVGLRGSVPIVLAIYPIMFDVPYGEMYFNVAFVIVIFSLLVQGASILPMAKMFRVYAPSIVAPISKGDIGISIDDDYQIFSYEILHNKFQDIPLRDIKFPSKTQVAAVFKKGQMVKPNGGTTLRKGDVVSIIGHNEDEEFLNFIFNGNANVRKTPHFYHGDIILDGKLKMTEVSRDYSLIITSLEKPLTLNEFLSYQLGGFPTAGDRLTIIDIRLYVKETQEDKITKIGYEKLDSI